MRGPDSSVFWEIPIMTNMAMSSEMGRLPEDFKAAPADTSWVGIPGNVDHKGMVT